MVNVDANFHTLAASDNPITRVRIYFIGDGVDCTDDNDVETNGYLLVSDVSETNSNSIIGKNGITIDEYFNKELNVTIGETASSTFSTTFLNSNGMLNNFQFGRCKVYLDVYDSSNSTWYACPMGVYIIDMPTKRRVQLISVTAYDQMQLLDAIADNWWGSLDFSAGLTPIQILQSMGATLRFTVNPDTVTNLTNGTYSFAEAPFASVEMTYRDILEYIAEFCASIAFFDRDGQLTLRLFETAQIGGSTYTVDADTLGNNCLAIDVAEYTVGAIDKLQVAASDLDIGVIKGTGNNGYKIVDNPFLFGASEAEIDTKATPIYTALNGIGAYVPVDATILTDWSICSGDEISVTYSGETYRLPIFQQRLEWRGAFVKSQMWCSGDPKLPELSATNRAEYRDKRAVHELEVTVETLRSLITDMGDNYTLIEQTVNSIQQVVSAQGVTISDILDPSGEIWTAITTNSTNLSNVSSALNNEITERKSYIRFIPAEPAIVLGVDTGNEIKLKMVNNIIYFFNGQDDSTDLSLAYAYFNSEEAYATRFVAGQSLRFGTENDAVKWLWRKLPNGDLVLDVV